MLEQRDSLVDEDRTIVFQGIHDAVEVALHAYYSNDVFTRDFMGGVIGRRVGESFLPEAILRYHEEKWPEGRDYVDIAWGKADISGRTGLPSRLVHLVYPHLLQTGVIRSDVVYWGSWIEADVIAAFSSQQPWFDEGFSRMAVGLYIVHHQELVEPLKAVAIEEGRSRF